MGREDLRPAPLSQLERRSVSMRVITLTLLLTLCGGLAPAARPGSAAEYIGGTLATVSPRTMGWLITTETESLVFHSGKSVIRIPYERINQIEYGQKVDRRLLEAALLSPLFALSKKRDHFVTVGYELEDGQQQALLFRVAKDDVRALLVSVNSLPQGTEVQTGPGGHAGLAHARGQRGVPGRANPHGGAAAHGHAQHAV